MPELPHDLKEGFSYHLLQLARRWRRIDEKIMQKHGFNNVSWVPLLHLYGAEPLMQKDLAAYCGVESSTLVRLITLLQSQGLIERKINPEDRRAHFLTLTNTGREEARRIAAIIFEIESRMVEGIPPELIQSFLHLSQLIGINIAQLEQEE
ncbi:MarR family winged helix-turn-helix transcriptional regulator [Falsigemmobacter faecalis]|uniref:MarR family transcriptional regulator n=1 Tax=Falsigemmobacter faecalis TaxID=2488730 RepID=A0A3P3D3M2_9RHOB|nr:MarR family winged helix-turn-helix transcriptional regulator [Falsigemmobacter faecalis]RRH67962.1 MarR family transcriptional regulator [Falsigemmobacter faecalis]